MFLHDYRLWTANTSNYSGYRTYRLRVAVEIIIDAYNLIFQCGLEGRHRTATSIRRSRQRLLSELAGLLPSVQRQRTTVVFDAASLPAGETQLDSQRSGLRVLFSVGYPDADTLIEELINNHSHAKDLLVVSSDHRIQKSAQRRKAKTIDSDVWWDQLEYQSESRLPQEPSNTSDSLAKVGDSDDPWLSEFAAEMSRPKNLQPADELPRTHSHTDHRLPGSQQSTGDPAKNKNTPPTSPQDSQHQLDFDEAVDMAEIDWLREFGFDQED